MSKCNVFDPVGFKYPKEMVDPRNSLNNVMSVQDRIGYEQNSIRSMDIRVVNEIRGKLVDIFPKMLAFKTEFNVEVKPIEYIFIADAIRLVSITPEVIANFIKWAGYTEHQMNSDLDLSYDSPKVKLIYDLLEFYLDPNFAKRNSRSTCSSIIGRIQEAVGFLSYGANLINQLKNFSLSSILSNLTSWSDMLKGIVDQLKGVVLQRIENFLGQATGSGNFSLSSLQRLMTRVDRAKSFLSDLNINTIKEKIEEIIARIAGQFEDITPEALIHILMVICQLIDSIKAFLESPASFIENMFSTFTTSLFGLQQFTNYNLATTTAMGLPRYSPAVARGIAHQSRGTGSDTRFDTYVPRGGITDEEATILQQILNTGSSARVTHTERYIKEERENNGLKFGYKKVLLNNPILYVILHRIGNVMNKRFTINSAYRSPSYNSGISGAATHSYHTYAMALDVSGIGDSNDIAKFIELASKEGIGGMAHYPNGGFVHIDIRGQKVTWNTAGSNSITKAAINDHVQGKFGSNLITGRRVPS